MSDFSSMSRESKKDKLRRQIVSPQQPAWNAEPEEDSEAVGLITGYCVTGGSSYYWYCC